MFNCRTDRFVLEIPPWPDYISSNFRYFMHGEKHITRICRDYVIIFMLERALLFSEDGYDIILNPGEWYLQLPGLKQEGFKGSPAPAYYYIHFRMSGFPANQKESRIHQNIYCDWNYKANIEIPVHGMFDIKKFIPLFNQLEFLKKNNPADLLGRQTLFLTIFNCLLSEILNKNVYPQYEAKQIMNYLLENFTEQLSSTDLVKRFNFTYDYIARIMKEYCGYTPWQYVQILRVEKAKTLLSNTDYSLSQITEKIGYNDITVFYKAFRKLTGIAPGKWRTKIRRL